MVAWLKLVPHKKEEGETLSCSFCGVPEEMVETLLAGTTVFICDKCVGFCVELLKKKTPQNPNYRFKHLSEKPIG